MDRPGVGWTWNEFDHLRAGGIGDIDDRPTEMPQMAHIEIPTSVRLHDGHLEARTIVEVAIANHTDILANTATRNGIGENATRQRRQQEQRQSENGFCHSSYPRSNTGDSAILKPSQSTVSRRSTPATKLWLLCLSAGARRFARSRSLYPSRPTAKAIVRLRQSGIPTLSWDFSNFLFCSASGPETHLFSTETVSTMAFSQSRRRRRPAR